MSNRFHIWTMMLVSTQARKEKASIQKRHNKNGIWSCSFYFLFFFLIWKPNICWLELWMSNFSSVLCDCELCMHLDVCEFANLEFCLVCLFVILILCRRHCEDRLREFCINRRWIGSLYFPSKWKLSTKLSVL